MATYLDTVDSDWFKQRLTGVIFIISATFVVLIVRLVYLQLIEGAEYRRLSESNSIRLQSVNAPRGLIFDRNGNMLVDNRPSFNLNIIPKDAKPIDSTIEKLAEHIDISREELFERLNRNKRPASYKPVSLVRDIGRNSLAAVEAHKYELPGVIVDIAPRRHYMDEQSAAHLLGYLGEISPDELKRKIFSDCKVGDFIGKFGIEKSVENKLRGKRGGRQVEVDATGQVVKVLKTVATQPGYNVFLTIDQELQKKAKALMTDKAGAVVAMDPATGEILTMVSNPSFDQNAFITGLSHREWNELITNPDRPLENKAVQAEYPPASTYKVITALAALEEGISNERTTVFCPGYHRFGDRTFRCWKRSGHGNVDIYKALAESCDVYFYQVGQELGIERLAWYARAFGLGSPTGIQLDHEARGLVPTAAWKKRRFGRSWQKGETLSVSIGQGYNLTTPLQMLMVISSIANNGISVKPSLVSAIRSAEGELIQRHEVKVAGRLPTSEKTLNIIRRGLWEAVNKRKGTAWDSRVKGLDICGKTGTAQVVGRKTGNKGSEDELPGHLRPHAWFVAYAPAVNPRIAVAVIVEHGEHGSSHASIATEVIRTYLQEGGDGNDDAKAHAEKQAETTRMPNGDEG